MDRTKDYSQAPVERVADAIREVIGCDGGTGAQAHHEASHSRFVERQMGYARDNINQGSR